MQFKSAQEVCFIRNKYPSGTRIRLMDQLKDPFSPIACGTEGTVRFVDDAGTIHMQWDNGRTLGLIYGKDSFVII